MSARVSERAFEDAIEAALLPHGPDERPYTPRRDIADEPPSYGDSGMRPGGYHKRRPEDYDRSLCLRPADILDFVLATQPKQRQRLSQHHGAEVRQRFLRRLSSEIDRRVLDRQLQSIIRQFEQTLGVVENIDTTSRQLRDALEADKTIIVTTLQKFPVIAAEIGQLPGKRFALIVDEAHSSQSGESTKSLKAVLSPGSLAEAESEESEAETPEEVLENAILAKMEKRGRLPNLSTFAFTATPKPRTLELFGTQRPDGSFAPFHL